MFTDLYHITAFSFAEGQINAQLKLDATHEIFVGHFPGQPILPGVCQLALVKDLVQRATQKTLTMRKADQAKFMAMVNPKESGIIEASIQLQGDGDGYLVQAVLKMGETVFLKTKVRFV